MEREYEFGLTVGGKEEEYRLIPVGGDMALAARKAIACCKERGIGKLTMEKGTYHFYPEMAAEAVNCCVSNHGHNGYRRSAFLLEDMRGFEVDGSGSLLIFHGAMNAFLLRRCEDVTIRNCNILYERTNHGQFVVKDVTEDYVDIQADSETVYVYEDGLLYLKNEQGLQDLVYTCEEIDAETLEFAAGEQCFGRRFLLYKNEAVDDHTIRIWHPDRKPSVGNYVVLVAAERYANGILFLESSRVAAEDCCVHSCFGIAYHAQLSRDVRLERCRTEVYGNRCFSANADASHFVGCSGQVVIRDCRFQNQLDDGVNVHGVFTKILRKAGNSLFVKYEHDQCRGIGLFQDGCCIQLLNPQTLIPYRKAKVVKAVELNTECTQLFLNGELEDVEEGDLVDSIDFYPDVLIEGCRFTNNRARGILVGSRRDTVIRGNEFHLGGTAIKLESDSKYWYESGGVGRLIVEQNVFDRCLYLESESWGRALIETTPRDKLEEGCYYHGDILIRNNDFSKSDAPAVDVENVERFVFEGNRIGKGNTVEIRHCKSSSVQQTEWR